MAAPAAQSLPVETLMSTTIPRPLFTLGRVVATPGALEALRSADMDARELLRHHAAGDWGDVGVDDARENDLSVRQGFRILSSYRLPTAATIWIITEADRRDG
jgi:hypothetical protein